MSLGCSHTACMPDPFANIEHVADVKLYISLIKAYANTAARVCSPTLPSACIPRCVVSTRKAVAQVAQVAQLRLSRACLAALAYTIGAIRTYELRHLPTLKRIENFALPDRLLPWELATGASSLRARLVLYRLSLSKEGVRHVFSLVQAIRSDIRVQFTRL
jgi:hypothetical protein